MSHAGGGGSVLPQPAFRRYLAILFSDLSDSTRLGASMEAEHYADLLTAVRLAYQEVISKHGGTVVRVQGDGVLAIFGYPDASEDDGRRATEAALDLHAMVESLRFAPDLPTMPSLHLHTGIHSGLVLIDQGDLVRGRFELIGDPPNIAARLSAAAAAGEILVSEETLGPESHFFQTSERRYLSLKGRADPLAVYQILARAPVHSKFEARAQRGLTPFVGRQAELWMLEQTLGQSMTGRPAYVAVSAPAGLGKTRLVEEFLRRAALQDCQIHRGYCESYLSAEPLQPFLQVLRALFGLTRRMPPTQAAELLGNKLAAIHPELLVHRADLLRALSLSVPEAGRVGTGRPAVENTIAALRALFDRLAAWKPLILFIDDWQWADDGTRHAINAIRNLDRRCVFVLTAARGSAVSDADMRNAQILELAPFTEDEAAETISRLLPRVDPFVMMEIRSYAGGNPMFLEELCHSAAFGEGDRRIGRTVASAAWLNILIASRLARLPDAQADLARAAAIIGNVIPSWLLESITGCGEHHPLLRRLAEQDFIYPGEKAGILRFKHGIVRDVIYDAVGLRQRKAMHLRIAESLRQQGSTTGGQEDLYEALAYHYGAGGQATAAAQYAELAGDKAVAASALDRAQLQYRAALTALDLLEPSNENYRRWMAIAQRLALACVFDPSRDQLDVLRRAVALASARDDQVALAGAEYWLGYVQYALGEPREAILHLERALDATQLIGDDRLIGRIRATLGQARAAGGDYERALALFEEAIAVKRHHRTSTRPAVGFAYTLACKAAVLGDRGLFAQSQACFEEALDAVRGANHEVEASVLGWRSAICLWQGRWEDALQAAADAQRVGERVRSFFIFATNRALGAFANWSMQRAPASLQTIIDATAWLKARNRQLNISLNYGWLAEAMVASGRFQEMRSPVANALVRARKYDRLGLAMTYRALARASAQGHGRERPERYIELAMDAARARDSRHEIAVTQLCEAEIAANRDDRVTAIALLDHAEAAFEAMQMDWHLGNAQRLRARL